MTNKIKKLEHQIKKLEAKIKQMEEITVFNSITKNWLSWAFIFISIYCITPNQYGFGILSFFVMFFISYYLHVETHKKNTVFTLLHRYHHSNNNYFSHVTQCVLELCFPFFFLVIYSIFGTILLDKWIILFSVVFYSSIHNINYSYFHVNKIHSLHHTHPFTNYGPDVCDILFGTKHEGDPIENTNHYIPNIIVITLCILGLKQLCNHETFNTVCFKSISYFLISCVLIYLGASATIFYGFV